MKKTKTLLAIIIFGLIISTKFVNADGENAPAININGSRTVIIDKGLEYVDEGAEALDDLDGDISNSIESFNNVDTSKTGVYYVRYSVTDSNDNEAEAYRYVYVVEKASHKYKDSLKNIGNSGHDKLNDVTSLKNGGYIIVGSSEIEGKDYDAYIVLYDNNGGIIFEKIYGEEQKEEFNEVIETTDSHIVSVGFTHSSKGYYTGLIVKYDLEGNLIWNTTKGMNGVVLNSVVETSDSEFIVVGKKYKSSFGGNELNADTYIAKIGTDGDVLEEYVLNFRDYDEFTKIITTFDGQYVVVGNTHSNNYEDGVRDGLIVKFNENLNKLWDRKFGETYDDNFTSVVENDMNEYVVVGYTSSSENYSDVVITKYSDTGVLKEEETTTFSGTGADFATDIVENTQGEYLISGYTNSTSGDITGEYNLFDGFIIKVNANFSLIDKTVLGGSDNDWLNSIDITQFNNYVAVGKTSSSDGDINSNILGSSDGLVISDTKYIYLFGVEDVVIKTSEEFDTLNGVSAIDANGDELEVKLQGNVDVEVEGTYELIYTVENDDYKIITCRLVDVKNDILAPTLSNISDKVIKVGTEIDLKKGITAFDETDGDLTSSIEISGDYDINKSGKYIITVSVTDKSGNTATKNFDLIVEEGTSVKLYIGIFSALIAVVSMYFLVKLNKK